MTKRLPIFVFVLFVVLVNTSVFAADKANFTFKAEVCENDTAIFRSISSVSSASITEYAWDFDGDDVYDTKSSVDTSYFVYKTSDINTKYGGAHAFNVKLRIVTSLGDTLYSVSKSIKVNYLPVLTNSESLKFDSVACRLQPVQFFNNFYVSEGTIANTYWYFNDKDETYTTTFFKRSFDTVGVYNISILAVSDKYCKTRTTGKLRIKQIPSGSFNYSGDTTFYNDKYVDITVKGEFKSLIWEKDGSTLPTLRVKESGKYKVTLTNEESCSVSLNSSNINVLIEKPLEAMNTLTLNGDRKNEIWKIFEIEAYGICKVKVYNSNGVLVYESDDYQNNWEAKDSNGNYLPQGAYYYTIQAAELAETIKGTINILH